jgi:hypothetical protein
VTKSFEKAIGRKFASVKRKIASLEEQWRAKFAVRDAQPGLQGNNNTELARAMRTWIAFRDEEERVKREKEEDEKALAVRRERLHELESERLGLTDVCRYETTMAGEEEETGPQGVDTGDRSNPISLEDAVEEELQQPRPVNNLYRDLEPADTSNEKVKKTDPVTPIVELLRKRQREEREEADIRREEQVLLNKRLAMMEEQVQMLGRLLTQREQRPQPASQPASQPVPQPAPPPRPVIIDLGEDANEVPARFQVGAGARPQLTPQSRPAAIELDGNANESTEAPTGPQADAGAVGASSSAEPRAEVSEVSTVPVANAEAANASNSPEAPAESAEVSTDMPMPDVPANTTAGSETAALHMSGSNDAPQYPPNVSMDDSADVPDETPAGSKTAAADTERSNEAPTEHPPDVYMDGSADVHDESPAVSETPAAMDTSETKDAPEYSPNVPMDGSADVLDETPADSGNEIPDDAAEAQVDVEDSPATADAATAAEPEAETMPEDAIEAQATEHENDEESIATPISEEE